MHAIGRYGASKTGGESPTAGSLKRRNSYVVKDPSWLTEKKKNKKSNYFHIF